MPFRNDTFEAENVAIFGGDDFPIVLSPSSSSSSSPPSFSGSNTNCLGLAVV